MRKIIGSICSITGLAGVLYFGYQYIQDSESFSLFGADVTITTGDYVPILFSAILLAIGLWIVKS